MPPRPLHRWQHRRWQVKLLRVLENGTFRRLGGTTDIKVDVRIISATNKDLKEEIAAGRFREDLFYRLNVVPIHIPPLRERKEDIPLLVDHFLAKTSSQAKSIAPNAMKLFVQYPWKGNVRELENVIQRISLLIDKREITPDDLPPEITESRIDSAGQGILTTEGVDIDELIGSIEKRYIPQALDKAHGVKTEAGKLLHLSFRSFPHSLQKYGIK